jgi:hypothetical protein
MNDTTKCFVGFLIIAAVILAIAIAPTLAGAAHP